MKWPLIFCLERRTVEIQISCYHGKVISRFSQLFVGDKDNIFHFYLRTVYSHNVQLSALLIFLFLKRLFHFAGFTDHDYLFKVNAQ